MPKVIKPCEYGCVKNSSIFPSNTGVLQTKDGQPTSLNKIEKEKKSVVDQALEKAKQIMESAQEYSLNQVKESTQRMNEEAAQVLSQSRDEGYSRGLTEGKKAGSKIGYEDGCEQGQKKAEEELEATMSELVRMLETVETMKSEILQKYEADIGKLAMSIAGKVIKSQLSMDANVMQSIIKDAADTYVHQSWMKILVSKNTKAMLENADISIIKELSEISENVKIEAFPGMNDGDCKIDMPDSMVDAGVDSQLAKIKNELEM